MTTMIGEGPAMSWTAALVLVLAAQGAKKQDVDLVDPFRVDAAIRKGVAYLKTVPSPPGPEGAEHSDELVLLTFLHAGLAEDDAVFRQRLASVLAEPLARTYKVALKAMALEELDRVRHQVRIWECAQFLVDNQGKSGLWSYGTPTTLPALQGGTPTGGGEATTRPRPAVVDFGPPGGSREKPAVTRRLPVKVQREGEDSGDASNSQYAALGLRACHEAGIVLPRATLEKAAERWRRSQERQERQEEDDEDERKKKRRPSVPTGPGAPAPPLGWSYGGGEETMSGSMTAGAVGALVIYDSLLGKPWRDDRDVAEGLSWLAKNFTVTKNPGAGDWHYYYLYGLERVGRLCDLERIGAHPWYSKGAMYILDAQKPDGSWTVKGEDEENTVWNTCFAILFLKRATRPADVASVDPMKR